MIALDASVLIALLDGADAHHARADALFAAAARAAEPLTIGPVNQGEVLVEAAREGRDQQMLADLRALGVAVTPLPDDAGLRLARLRAHTGARMPDCCVLLTAEQTSARVATFDARLAAAARALGLETT